MQMCLSGQPWLDTLLARGQRGAMSVECCVTATSGAADQSTTPISIKKRIVLHIVDHPSVHDAVPSIGERPLAHLPTVRCNSWLHSKCCQLLGHCGCGLAVCDCHFLPVLELCYILPILCPGLPYTTSEAQVLEFFAGYNVNEVAFVYEPDGRPSGLVSGLLLARTAQLQHLESCWSDQGASC